MLSTDLGQTANPPVEDGLGLMADRLLEAGFDEEEVHTMAVVNTRRLAGVTREPAPARDRRALGRLRLARRRRRRRDGRAGGEAQRDRALLRRARRVGRAVEGARPDDRAGEGDPPRGGRGARPPRSAPTSAASTSATTRSRSTRARSRGSPTRSASSRRTCSSRTRPRPLQPRPPGRLRRGRSRAVARGRRRRPERVRDGDTRRAVPVRAAPAGAVRLRPDHVRRHHAA